MKEIIIVNKDANQRFDKYLKRYLINATPSFIYKMLRKKNITLNGKKATGNELLKEQDVVKIFFQEETLHKFTTVENTHVNAEEYQNAFRTLKDVSVIFENEHVILLNKPAGILTQKAKEDDISLNEWLIGYLLEKHKLSAESLLAFKPSVLNRLDRNTSGIVLCGKSLIGSREVSKILKDRSLDKYYRLYVEGKVKNNASHTAYLHKNEKTNKVVIKNELSKQDHANDFDMIQTDYKVIDATNKYSYLEAKLVTGKTHQLRAHFSYLGHPIVGDKKYGKPLDKIPYQLLHAYRIVFPVMHDDLKDLSGKEFMCPLPELFKRFKENYYADLELQRS